MPILYFICIPRKNWKDIDQNLNGCSLLTGKLWLI